MTTPKFTTLQTLKMPQVGIGTWQSAEGEVRKAIDWALEAGVRLIDTAFMYGNEAEIGETLEKWLGSGKIKREELFVVTKAPTCAMRPERIQKFLDISLKNLKLDYVDLYLLHGPCGNTLDEATNFVKFTDGKVEWETDTDHVAIWREMEKAVDFGKAKSIGVSNFTSAQIKRIMDNSRIPVAANQVECHAYFQQRALKRNMEKMGVKLMAYSPLGSPGTTFNRREGTGIPFKDPVIAALAEKYKVTPAQILLRAQVQTGNIVIPKSTKMVRIVENFSVFNFEISPVDMDKIEKLDKGTKGSTFDMTLFPSDQDMTTLATFPKCADDEY